MSKELKKELEEYKKEEEKKYKQRIERAREEYVGKQEWQEEYNKKMM